MAALALVPVVRSNGTVQATSVRLGLAALAVLVLGLVLAWSPLVAASIALAGAAYGGQLAIDDAPLDELAPVLAALVLAAAELGYWSLDERERVVDDEGGSVRRVAIVVALALGALVVGGLLLSLVDLVRARGLALDVTGAIAAAGVLAVVVLLGREFGNSSA